MKASKSIRFLRNGLFLILVVGLMLILSFPGYTQQEVKVIRTTTSWAPNIDPAVGCNYLNSVVFCNVYDSLVFPYPDGGVKPWLAKSWEISEDGLTYTFELTPGVKFHNGDEITADDVVFSMERIMAIGQGFGYLFIPNVEGAKALEKYKVQFTLKGVFSPFMDVVTMLYILNKNQVMANIEKEGPYGEFGDYGKGWLTTHDAGSGPYKVKEMKMQEYLLMEKFDDYWAGWENKEDAPQYVKEIGTIEPITVKTLMSRGDLEFSDCWQTAENNAAIDELPNTELVALFAGSLYEIYLNTTIPPTDDIHFRKALAYCIDYEQFESNIFPGARPAAVVAPSLPGYNPNLKPYTMDLAKAEEELKQSPYYGKLDQYPFEFMYTGGSLNHEKIVLMVQANAAKIGIKVEPLALPIITSIDKLSRAETTANGTPRSSMASYAEAGAVLQARYHKASHGTTLQGEWLQDPKIDAMIEDAISTVDKKERFEKYYAIQEIIYELCPTIWFGEVPANMIYRSDYIVFPAAELIKQGKPTYISFGYNQYYRDFKVLPEKAQPPYTPFKP